MKSTNDNPTDPFGSLGKPIRQEKPTAPDPVKEFERISDHAKAIETVAEALGHITSGQAEDWEGIA